MPNTPILAVVVDEKYGDRLAQLSLSGPVWIVDSATNHLAVEKQWKENPTRTHLLGVTVFDKCGVTNHAQIFMNVLDMLDLHHGGYSSDSPYNELHVIGTGVTTEIREQLSKFQFTVSESNTGSFRANRHSNLSDAPR